MNVAIVGSRRFPNLELVRHYVQHAMVKGDVLITGGAPGVDREAARAADLCGIKVVVFLPHWNRWGPAAGQIRNQRVVDKCDRLVAFWDGSSRGTADALRRVQAAGKPFKVFDSGFLQDSQGDVGLSDNASANDPRDVAVSEEDRLSGADSCGDRH